jgi:hypothetical protein
VEIAKSLPGRNDNAVKNYFYSSIRKYIRKIAKGRISAEQKSSQIAKTLSIYFTQYIRKMYSDYLQKVSLKKQHLVHYNNEDSNMEIDGQDEETRQQILRDYEMEESKEEKAKSMKTGEKYIIRKLISFKINIPKIDDYLQKLNSLEIKAIIGRTNSFGMSGFNQPASATNLPVMNNNFSNQGQENYYNMNPFKTFQGYNDDSQIAYQSKNFLFQQQMGQPNQFMPQMANMNFCWDGNSFN